MDKDILRNTYIEEAASTEDYTQGVYVYWRVRFYVNVNYSSDNYGMNLPSTAQILVGENVLKPAGVLIWIE